MSGALGSPCTSAWCIPGRAGQHCYTMLHVTSPRLMGLGASRDRRLALLSLGLSVGRLLKMILQNQADVIRQRALCDVGPTLQLVPFG